MLRQCQGPVGKWILDREQLWKTLKEPQGAWMVWLYLTGDSFRRKKGQRHGTPLGVVTPQLGTSTIMEKPPNHECFCFLSASWG